MASFAPRRDAVTLFYLAPRPGVISAMNESATLRLSSFAGATFRPGTRGRHSLLPSELANVGTREGREPSNLGGRDAGGESAQDRLDRGVTGSTVGSGGRLVPLRRSTEFPPHVVHGATVGAATVLRNIGAQSAAKAVA